MAMLGIFLDALRLYASSDDNENLLVGIQTVLDTFQNRLHQPRLYKYHHHIGLLGSLCVVCGGADALF